MKQACYFILSLLLFTACSNQDLPISKDINKPIKCLVLGNSITVHPICDYWWGVWGMAASKPENDFVHRLESKVREKEPRFTCDAMEIVKWETSLELSVLNFKALIIPSYKNEKIVDIGSYKYIVIRLGENMENYTNSVIYENAFEELINTIKALNPTATIAITGVFWPNEYKEKGIKDVAIKENITYINIDYLCVPENKEEVGNYVFGNDGKQHLIEDDGVANHPNDAGMEAIAESIYKAVF